MDHLDGIDVELAVVLGAADLPIGEVLEISRGATIGLNTREDAPSRVYANGQCIAAGQIIVNGETMAVEVVAMGGVRA